MPGKITSVEQAMHEYKAGELHSGKGGPVVRSRRQAIAIGLSGARKAGKKVPPAKRALMQGRR